MRGSALVNRKTEKKKICSFPRDVTDVRTVSGPRKQIPFPTVGRNVLRRTSAAVLVIRINIYLGTFFFFLYIRMNINLNGFITHPPPSPVK